MKKTVLVVGGAGYIGSHTAYLLAQAGFHVIILDNLLHGQGDPSRRLSSLYELRPDSSGRAPFQHDHSEENSKILSQEILQQEGARPEERANLASVSKGRPDDHIFIKADFADQKILKHIFQTYTIDAVMHFAAFIEVGESVKRPADFYHNNVIKTIQLLDVMREYNIKNFIFSSSCAVYGVPQKLPLTEDHIFAPINPYGKNKLIIEYVLQDYARAYGLNYVSLRYFNAAGALPECGFGEMHKPETHVIPLLLRAARDDKKFTILGDDYPTRDGTCVRDYVHVLDIAQAHVLAFDYLEKTGLSNAFNLGSEAGYTVRELITHVQQITGLTVPVRIESRRAGDVPVLVADATNAKNILGWRPEHSDIKNILHSAWAWELTRDITMLEYGSKNNLEQKSR